MPHQYNYPSRMGRIILATMQELAEPDEYREIVTRAGLSQFIDTLPAATLDRTFSFEWVSALQEAGEAQYGVEAGRAFNQSVGRGALGGGLREFNPLVGIADLPIRALPLSMKLHVGFDMFAMVFNRFTDQVVTLGEDDRVYKWNIQRCPVCWGRKTDAPCCNLAVGILEAGLAWTSGGKQFNVTQTHCRACGDEACVIEISKRPVRA